MTLYRMTGANHVEDGKIWAGSNAVVESEHPLDQMFPNKFVESTEARVSESSRFLTPGIVTGPVRATAGSEAQNTQKPNRGHEVPVGSCPPDEVDEENASGEVISPEEERQAVAGGEGFFDPEFEQPQVGGSPLFDVNAPKVQRRKAQSRKASKGSKSSAETDDEDNEPSDVTGDFPKAAECGCSVVREGKTYFVLNENGNKVGEKAGYTSKAAVNEELAARAAK